MLKLLGMSAILAGFFALAIGASPVLDEDEINEEINIRVPPAGMVLIPAGRFLMGSEDEDAHDDEQPVHTVYVDAFYMDIYEVTNAQFKVFVDANPQWQKDNIEDRLHFGFYLDHWTSNDYPAGKANHPVTRVSWYAAMAYANWAGKRLPTEAEWEYAARGGMEGQKYPWGNTITPNDANVSSQNGYGLYDMAGNVQEWCLDKYDADFYDAHNSRNPISGAVTLQEILDNFASVRIRSCRVLRGGSWGTGAQNLRVANRSWGLPTFTYDSIGFRCVRAVAR